MHPSTGSTADKQQSEFYDILVTLARKIKGSDIVVVSGYINVQVGKLSGSEPCSGGHCLVCSASG